MMAAMMNAVMISFVFIGKTKVCIASVPQILAVRNICNTDYVKFMFSHDGQKCNYFLIFYWKNKRLLLSLSMSE